MSSRDSEENTPKRIDQRITGYKVKQDGADSADSAPPGALATPTPTLEQMHEAMARPDMLRGATYKVKPPGADHALYVTINDMVLNAGTPDETRVPYEIFINSKNMEHYQWVLALTRIISAVFRKGGSQSFLAEELKVVFDPQGGHWRKGEFIPSLVAELGLIIERHLSSPIA